MSALGLSENYKLKKWIGELIIKKYASSVNESDHFTHLAFWQKPVHSYQNDLAKKTTDVLKVNRF